MDQKALERYLSGTRLRTSTSAFAQRRSFSESDFELSCLLNSALSELPAGSKVLEIGIGRGETLREIRRSFPHLRFYGTNYFSQESPAFKEGVNAEGASLPFRNNAFDLVFCTHVAQYVPDKAKLLEEVHRVLRPNRFGLIHAITDSSFRVIKGKTQVYAKKHFNKHPQVRFMESVTTGVPLVFLKKNTPRLRLPLKLNLTSSVAHEGANGHFESVYDLKRSRK